MKEVENLNELSDLSGFEADFELEDGVAKSLFILNNSNLQRQNALEYEEAENSENSKANFARFCGKFCIYIFVFHFD